MGYVIESVLEAEKMLRKISFYTVIGLGAATTEGQKQFILERIHLELGLSVKDVREKFGAVPGEAFDISAFLVAWEVAEARCNSENK